MSFLKKRELESHKGENGRVLIIGGSNDYVGAPALAGLAALRTGVDNVTVAAPEKAAWVINSYSPDLIVKKFEGDFFNWDNVKDVIELAEDFDVIQIGSGLGAEENTKDFVKEIVERLPNLKVIDADALKALEGAEIRNAILTPHETEFEILTGEKLPKEIEGKAEIVKKYARAHKVILLKGSVDIIANHETIRFNKTGNPGMTVGGTGDVLTGLAAGFLAQSKDLFNSAYAAAYLNGKIGDYLYKKKGYGFTASDIVENICSMKKRLRWI